jgi:hypothetical protein
MRDGRIAGQTLGRVDQMKRGLQSCLIPLSCPPCRHPRP